MRTESQRLTRVHTLDEAGAFASGEPAQPRGRRYPSTEEARAVEQNLRNMIVADNPVVLEWVAEAKRRLEAGDATEALCLGRDLHWLSAGRKDREDLACELLATAYRALGRHSLAGIVQAHHRHRALPSVGVLEFA